MSNVSPEETEASGKCESFFSEGTKRQEEEEEKEEEEEESVSCKKREIGKIRKTFLPPEKSRL